LLQFQSSLGEAVMKGWWKSDIERWRMAVEGSSTAAQMRLLVAWILRGFKRVPGTELPEEEYYEEVYEEKKPEKEEPKMDRRERRIQERVLREAAAIQEAKEKTKKNKKQLKQKEEDEIHQAGDPWNYDGLLPEWAFEGALCWAKVYGFPWWPALVNAPEESEGRKRRPSKSDYIWVYNLGAGNFSEVKPVKCIQPYNRETIKKFKDEVQKMKKAPAAQFREAMRAANDILEDMELANSAPADAEQAEDQGDKRKAEDGPVADEPDAKKAKA